MPLPLLLALIACNATTADKPNPASGTPGPTSGTPAVGAPVGTPAGTPAGTPVGTLTEPTPVLAFNGPVPTNLLMISVDTLRKDHVGSYGTLGLTPFLDTWMQTGVVMEAHQQCSNWTFGSGTCTMHGRYSADIGLVPRLGGASVPAPATSPTLATALTDHGYYTILVTGNGYMSPNWNSATGYHEWDLNTGGGLAVGQEGVERLGDAVAAGLADDGWFLHLHYMEPHQPYNPEEAHIVGLDLLEPWPDDLTVLGAVTNLSTSWDSLTQDEQSLALDHLAVYYQGDVRMVDARIEWTVQQLEAAGLMDDTLVVFWTDHGEQFREHGLFSHAYELQYGENDGALFFWANNIVPGSTTELTSAIDTVPTVLSLLGAAIPPEMTGQPIGTAPADRLIFADSVAKAGVVQSVTDSSRFKVHYSWDGTVRAYDRAVDPLETNDLYDPAEPRVVALWPALCAERDRLDALLPESPTDPVGLPCAPATGTGAGTGSATGTGTGTATP